MEVRDCIELLYNLKILDKKLIDLFEKKILEDEKFKKEYEKLFHGKSK